MNPRALAIADSMDRERARGRIHGPLHGIPVALKDNIHTTTMRTTGGALAFADLVPSYDATLARNLERAGAIIIAKTQLTELANWVASGMPANYNALTGYGMNPWDPRRDPRESTFDGRPVLSTGGSSSGVGTNVSFWAAQRRHRDVGVDPEPLDPEHAGGDQADGGTREPVRRHPDHGGPGHAGPDGAHGDRRRHHARRHGGDVPRPARFGDDEVHAARRERLHAAPEPEGARGRADRHPARLLLRQRDHRRQRDATRRA